MMMTMTHLQNTLAFFHRIVSVGFDLISLYLFASSNEAFRRRTSHRQVQAFGTSARCGSAVSRTPHGLYSAGTGELHFEVQLYLGVGGLPICIY